MPLYIDQSLRLPESEYFPEPQRKSGIAIHHTVCDSARITLRSWTWDREKDGGPKRIGTAYVIDKDGTIFEAFDPSHWAWQFGLPWAASRRIPFEKRFIGIELVSWGPLVQRQDGRFYPTGLDSPEDARTLDQSFDCGTEFRGYRWFDRYEDAQLESLGHLVNDLCTRFSIRRAYPERPFLFYGDTLLSFEGVIGHAMVRPDKSDPAPDPRIWQHLRDLSALQPMPVSPPVRTTSSPTAKAVFLRNVKRLDRMNVAAGSLVKSLMMELTRRGVLLEFKTPQPGSHAIGYRVARGDQGKVAPLAKALGFKTVTERLLEVADD